MFEKESREYAIGLTYPKFQDEQIANIVLRDVEGAFQKGAELAYNKANEWHYCKDKLPPRKNSTSEDSKDVFVATKGYGNYEGHYVFAEETWFNINGEIIPAVYAWIELPVPPKEIE